VTLLAAQVVIPDDRKPRRTIERWRERGRFELTPLARLAFAAEQPPPTKPEPLSEADLVELLEAQARRGNVRAIELLLARRAKGLGAASEDDPFAFLDEIAERRRAKLRGS
jgi:hypothetical protein